MKDLYNENHEMLRTHKTEKSFMFRFEELISRYTYSPKWFLNSVWSNQHIRDILLRPATHYLLNTLFSGELSLRLRSKLSMSLQNFEENKKGVRKEFGSGRGERW